MASNINKPRRKTKKAKCGYCDEEMIDQNLKSHYLEVHQNPKLLYGERPITSSTFFGKKRKLSEVQTEKNELVASKPQIEKQKNAENEKRDEILLRVKENSDVD